MKQHHKFVSDTCLLQLINKLTRNINLAFEPLHRLALSLLCLGFANGKNKNTTEDDNY